MEDRLAPAVIMVTTAADDATANDGTVSLREAIAAINAGITSDQDILNQNPGTFGANDTIALRIPQTAGSPVVQTINVGSSGHGALPAITRPVLIDGYAEPGASANTLANGDDAKIAVELNGAAAGANASGLTLGTGSSGSKIQGLAINRFSGPGITVNSSSNVIVGNFIGTNPAGTAQEPNQGDGILVFEALNNTIGGATPDARNVISGNALDGIHIVGTSVIPATGNVVRGNFVGVNADGTGSVGVRPSGSAAGTASGNFLFGIEISGGFVNTIGGATVGAGNVIGFNLDGIEIDNGGQNNVIQGNFSGVGADGITPVGNIMHGIALRSDDNLAAPLGPGQVNEPAVANNLIGGIASNGNSPGNVVAFNGSAGVAVFGNPAQNSFVQAQNAGNTIEGNSIFQNGRSNPATLAGIDLSNQFVFPQDDGVTLNDSGKNLQGQPAPHGNASNPNNFQNFPVLSAVNQVSGGIQITGTFTQSVSHNTTFRIEFFASNPDPLAGVPEGQTFLGFSNVTTDGAGKASFSVTLNASVTSEQLITATATNLTSDPSSPAGSVSVGNTSEFSAAVQLTNPAPTITSLSPSSTVEGSGPISVTITGSNFVANSKVFLNGAALATTFLSNTQLKVTIPATATGDEASLMVTVQNPAPGGGTSNQKPFRVLESLLPDGTRGTANQRFISEVYNDLLKRAVDPGGLATWAGALDRGVSRSQVVLDIENSQEYRTDEVQAVYNRYLHRAADPGGLNWGINFLSGGGTVEQMIAAVAGSPEYYVKRGGNTNDGFLDAFYADALNRPVDSAGRATWDKAFANGATTAQVALAILSGDEYRKDLVRSFYLQFLDRTADDTGLAAFVNALKNGSRDEDIIAGIVGSAEFFNKTAS